MDWIVNNIDWVLIVAGVGTCTVLLQALTPQASARLIWGEEVQGTIGLFISRSWGVMVFCAGLLLIYAAYVPAVRLPILLYAIVGKLSFSLQVLANPKFYRQFAFVLALLDLVIIALLAWYLVAASLIGV